MNTSALITMIAAQGIVICFAAYFFYRVLEGDHTEMLRDCIFSLSIGKPQPFGFQTVGLCYANRSASVWEPKGYGSAMEALKEEFSILQNLGVILYLIANISL